jgi:hypothetical protein
MHSIFTAYDMVSICKVYGIPPMDGNSKMRNISNKWCLLYLKSYLYSMIKRTSINTYNDIMRDI